MMHKCVIAYHDTSLGLDNRTPVHVAYHNFSLMLVKDMLPNSDQNIFGCQFPILSLSMSLSGWMEMLLS